MYRKLLDWFKDKRSVIIAFSGGVDSAVVAKAAFDVLGKNAIAATANSATMLRRELENAKIVAKEIGIKHEIFLEDEFENPKFPENSPQRCYHCRKGLVHGLKKIAEKYGADYIVDGANADDAKQHRPGILAMREAGVRSPLMELEIGKKKVRETARYFKISVYDKPSMACLASRIPYGEKITKEKLSKIETAEDFLLKLGFRQVRVRYHNNIARIEVLKNDIEKILKNRNKIVKKFKMLGFNYVTLDLEGYRSGSMDEVLKTSLDPIA